jgi:hypothetical protein
LTCLHLKEIPIICFENNDGKYKNVEFEGKYIRIHYKNVAQWLERWRTSLVAHGLIPGISRSESATYYKVGKPK